MKTAFLVMVCMLGLAAAPGACHPSRVATDVEHAGVPHDGVPVVARGHSHNDYYRDRPLLDALDARFMSVEADVFLVDGELLVAHDRRDCRADRTLRGMYLEPLAARARAGGGTIYTDAPRGTGPLVLLIDIKQQGELAYKAIDRQLVAYADVLTSCRGSVVTERAVTVIISGDIPRATIAAQQERRAFVDGRAPDLEGPAVQAAPASLVPMVSLPWTSRFTWLGFGTMPTAQRNELARLVGEAHARGYRLRFWGTPNLPAFWKELVAAGVDVVGVDDLGLGQQSLGGAPSGANDGSRPSESGGGPSHKR